MRAAGRRSRRRVTTPRRRRLGGPEPCAADVGHLAAQLDALWAMVKLSVSETSQDRHARRRRLGDQALLQRASTSRCGRARPCGCHRPRRAVARGPRRSPRCQQSVHRRRCSRSRSPSRRARRRSSATSSASASSACRRIRSRSRPRPRSRRLRGPDSHGLPASPKTRRPCKRRASAPSATASVPVETAARSSSRSPSLRPRACGSELAEMGVFSLRLPERTTAASGLGIRRRRDRLQPSSADCLRCPARSSWSHLAAGTIVDGAAAGETIVGGLDSISASRPRAYVVMEYLESLDALIVLQPDSGVWPRRSAQPALGRKPVGTPLDPLTPVHHVASLARRREASPAPTTRDASGDSRGARRSSRR